MFPLKDANGNNVKAFKINLWVKSSWFFWNLLFRKWISKPKWLYQFSLIFF